MRNINKFTYKYSRNNRSMDIYQQKYLASEIKKGEIIFIITKKGIIKDIIDKINISEKTIHIVGYGHTEVIKNLGYTIFKSLEEANERCEEALTHLN